MLPCFAYFWRLLVYFDVHWDHSICEVTFEICKYLSMTSILKFIYSEKATKLCKIFTLLLSYVVPVKSKMKILQNFVAFSEYMNFTMSICPLHREMQIEYRLNPIALCKCVHSAVPRRLKGHSSLKIRSLCLTSSYHACINVIAC